MQAGDTFIREGTMKSGRLS
ncbi:hypothetical protein GN244_ATG04068 [Phytophthora infestans]|uniref:Uncharacterized protein n=1 Tax=Phytophthora infestans TaxID=4787 RepID=A0A833TI46_PHYIN|nr:hypothetical protein GN244_ATG04068 [Phytophthora infestans]KAF4130735.1 hypothetical protein GN958_ATG20078 [Phytophthora infestans]